MQLLGANKQIENPDRILVGQEINIPSSAKQEPTTQKNSQIDLKNLKKLNIKYNKEIIYTILQNEMN